MDPLERTVSLIEPDARSRVARRRDLVVSEAFQARFRFERLLGAGASSTVYRAHDVAADRPVAIKILTRLESAVDRARFARESEFMARVDHVNVICLRETGVEAGHPYIVMDHAEGGTLRRLLRTEGRLSLARALEITADVLAGLEALHARGLVHRDLKPDNVLFSRGRARIADLGCAYDTAEGDAAGIEPGALVGTPRYMAPEQALGALAGPASDLYAVGLMLFEMLTGEPPFAGSGADDVLMQHLHAPPPDLAARLPWAPPPLAALVAAALAKTPAGRPASAAAFRQALARCRPAIGPSLSRPTYRLAVDREVAARAQSCHRAAVELLYREYAALVRAFLLANTGPLGLRDRTRAVFEIAYTAIPKVGAISFAHWLLRIAAHVASLAA